MTLMRYGTGLEVRIDGALHRFVDDASAVDGKKGWILKNLVRGDARLFTRKELNALFEAGALKAHHSDEGLVAADREAARRRRVTATDDLPPADALRRRARAEFLRRMRALTGESGMHARVAEDGATGPTLLKRALYIVSQALGEELGRPKKGDAYLPVSQATYYRWRRLAPDPDDTRALQGNFCARGRRNQIHPLVKKTIDRVIGRCLETAKDKKGVGRRPTLTLADLKADIDEELGRLRGSMPDVAEKLAMPSDSTVYRAFLKFPAFDRAVAQLGLSRARRDYRFIRGHEKPTGAYEIVEYDETRMPFFFVDEASGVPLGNGTLCVAIDVASQALAGFHISFEPFSDLTMMSTLRHACSLKGYVASSYPDIRNDWHQGGIIQCIALDNSKQAWGKTLLEVSTRLDCDKIWLPPRTPWFKPNVEGFFSLFERLLLEGLPGFNLFGRFDHSDYDAEKSACIGLRTFTYIFHKWLLDVHHIRPLPEQGHLSPNELWELALKVSEPGLLDSQDELESLFGIVRDGSVDHRGLLFRAIRYRSDDLQAFRSRSGSRKKVRFKFNPSDLMRVRVWDEGSSSWIAAEAEDPHYAKGLSLHVHDLVRRHTKDKNRVENAASLRQGLNELREMIAGAIPQMKAATGASIARFFGTGTQTLFSGMDRQGCPEPAREWGGRRDLEHSRAAGEGVVPAQATRAGAPAQSLSRDSLEVQAAEPVPVPTAPRRPVRIFDADDSLRPIGRR